MSRSRNYGLVGQVVATLFGAVIWGGLFAILGAITQQPFKGAVAGSAVGAVIGFGFAKGRIGPVIPCMSAFAFVGAFLGPGCDADALSSALSGAAIGALLGATKLRGLLALIGGLIGVNVGAAGGGASGLIGLAAGAGFGWWIGHSLSKKPSSEEEAVLSEKKEADQG